MTIVTLFIFRRDIGQVWKSDTSFSECVHQKRIVKIKRIKYCTIPHWVSKWGMPLILLCEWREGFIGNQKTWKSRWIWHCNLMKIRVLSNWGTGSDFYRVWEIQRKKVRAISLNTYKLLYEYKKKYSLFHTKISSKRKRSHSRHYTLYLQRRK